MAIAFVQSTGKAQASATTSVTTAAFGAQPTVGNHIVVGVASWGNTGLSTSLSDTQSNSYTVHRKQDATVGQQSAVVGSAKIATSSGSFTVTASATGGNDYWDICAVEFSGLDPTTWKDRDGGGNSGTGATSSSVTASGANSQANELVVAILADSSNDTAGNIATPASTGYTSVMVEQNCVAVCGTEMSYKIVSSSETSSASWTHDSTTSEGTSSVIVTFIAAASAGGGGRTIEGLLLNEGRLVGGRLVA